MFQKVEKANHVCYVPWMDGGMDTRMKRLVLLWMMGTV
jgi:hypothetical protein